jgi:hypothetical protein
MKTNYIILILILLLFKINCYSQEDSIKKQLDSDEMGQMNLDFQNSRFDIEFVYDTVNIKAIEIDSLNIRFKTMLDNHIKTMKKFNKNRYCIIVRLWILNVNCIDKNEADSVCNLFIKNNFGNYIGYNIKINTLCNNNNMIYSITDYKKTYYYNYKGWDVVFLTNLNIDFPNSGRIKEVKYNLKYKDYVKRKNGKYHIWEINDAKVRKTKKHEWDGTSYRLFNHVVESSKCKTKTLFSL